MVDRRPRWRRPRSASPWRAASSRSARSVVHERRGAVRCPRRPCESAVRPGARPAGAGQRRSLGAALMAADAGREHRQLHLIGPGASQRPSPAPPASSGAATAWRGFPVAGNMLAGAAGHRGTARAFRRRRDGRCGAASPAMAAGQAAGGDKRGKQAAALRIHRRGLSALDLRVDDHAEPLASSSACTDKSLERFQAFVACLPRRDDPAGITDRDEIEAAYRAVPARATRAPA